jgi:hypothetical protein
VRHKNQLYPPHTTTNKCTHPPPKISIFLNIIFYVDRYLNLQKEIGAVDVETGVLYTYGESKGYKQRAYLLYNGQKGKRADQ